MQSAFLIRSFDPEFKKTQKSYYVLRVLCEKSLIGGFLEREIFKNMKVFEKTRNFVLKVDFFSNGEFLKIRKNEKTRNFLKCIAKLGVFSKTRAFENVMNVFYMFLNVLTFL